MNAYINAIRKINESKLLKLKNVVGVGTGNKIVGEKDTKEECIRVYVKEKKSLYALSKKQVVPKFIDNIKTDVIEIGEIKALGYTEHMRPAKCGISIGHYKITAGTLGCLVRDRYTMKLLILSNNHVLAQSNKGKIGDSILQPGPYDKGTQGDLIGNLLRFIKIGYRSWWAFWTKEPKNKVDCAVASLLSERDVLPEILEIGIPKGTSKVEVGTKLQKTGRTTGYTQGEVIDKDVTVSVNYGDFIARFEHQIMAGAMSAGGDSGSAVLDMDKNIVGLLYAGSDKTTIMNPIKDVLDLLEVDVVSI